MGSLLPSNTFGGIGQELFVPVGGIEPEIDVIVQGTLTVLGNEVSFPDADLILGLGDVTARSATLSAQVSCNNLDVANLLQADRATITGELTAGSLELNGPLQLTTLTADSVVSIGPVSCGGLTSAGNVTVTGNGLITGNLIIDGSLSVTAGLPIPETVCGIVGVGAFGTGLIATVAYPAITSAGVVLLTPQTASAQIFNGIVFSVNVVAGVGFQIYASASAGGGLGIAWLIARL